MLGGIGTVIYACVINSQIGEVFSQFQSAKNGAIIALIVLGCFVFFIGLVGLIGTCRNNGCCISIYNLFNMVVAGLMVICALFFIIYFSKIKQDLQKTLNCTDTSQTFKDVDKSVNIIADTYFCTKRCPCKTNSTTYPTNIFKPWYNVADLQNGAQSVYQCKNYKADLSDINFSGDLNIIQFLENNLNCAGFCTAKSWRSFSKIALEYPQKPYKACGPALYDYLDNKGTMMGVFSAIIAVILTLSSLFAFCLCCHPDRHAKAVNDYSRMPPQ